jgi:arylsulfatase A-like enzyme
MSAIIAATCAAALAGALVGLGEALFITVNSSAAKEYWLFLFGASSYAVVSGLIGLGVAIVVQLLSRARAKSTTVVMLSVLGAVFLPVFAVARYHVIQRIFREDLVMTSATGIVTHVALLLAALAIAGGIGWLLSRLFRTAGLAGTLALLALILGGSWLAGKATAAPADQQVVRRARGGANKPNLILIVVDTLRADAIEPFGPPAGTTPAFASLARDGVAFTRTYAQASWTRPSIASILTSQYPTAHGAVQKMDFLPERAVTLAEVLKSEGYWTAGFANNINVAPVFNFQQGFDEYVYLEPSFYFGATESGTKLAIYKGLRVFRERAFGSTMYFPNYYQDAEVVNRRVMDWLGQKPPEPFFLFMHYMEPHDPYFEIPYNGRGVARVLTPNPPADQADELHQLYRDKVRFLDGHFDTLLKTLRQDGLYDRSVIAVTADHGEEFQEHGGWWHGTTLYDEALHVPFILKPAQGGVRGQTRTDVVRSVDIAPAMVAAAGLKMPPTFAGHDVMTGPTNMPLYAEEDLEGNQLTSIRMDRWKLITANPGNPRGLATIELYDVEADPKEKKNLAGTERDKVAELMAELQRIRAGLTRPQPRVGG